MCTPDAYRQIEQASNDIFPRPLRAGESRPNPDGSYSTEITMTERDATGMFFNFPSLYMTRDGIKQQAYNQMQSGGPKPAQSSMGARLDNAQRSAMSTTGGGTYQGRTIMQGVPRNTDVQAIRRTTMLGV
jgi:hypothetical protein